LDLEVPDVEDVDEIDVKGTDEGFEDAMDFTIGNIMDNPAHPLLPVARLQPNLSLFHPTEVAQHRFGPYKWRMSVQRVSFTKNFTTWSTAQATAFFYCGQSS
jgi:hypothetical protein